MVGRLKYCSHCNAPFHPRYTPEADETGRRLCYSCRQKLYGLPAPRYPDNPPRRYYR